MLPAVVGQRPSPGMNLIRSPGPASLCAFSSRLQAWRSRGRVRRSGVRNFQVGVVSTRKFCGTSSGPGIPFKSKSNPGCGLTVRVHATGSSNVGQEDGNKAVRSQEDGSRADENVQSQDEGDVQSQEATAEAASRSAFDVEHIDDRLPQDKNTWSKLRNRFVVTLDQLKEQHALYRQDVDLWGIGTSPIFTVHQDGNDRVTKVEINENEIMRRSGLEPLLPQLDDVESRREADVKLARAKALAAEMQAGFRSPPRGSTIFEIRKERRTAGKESGAPGLPAGGGGFTSLVGQAGDIMSRTPPWVRQTFFGFIFIYLFFLAWGARVLVSEELQKEQALQREQEAKKKEEDMLLKMKQSTSLRRAGLNTSQNGGSNPEFDTGQGESDAGAFRRFRPAIDKDELRKRVEHIQAMARQVRLSEKERSDPYTDEDDEEAFNDTAKDIINEVDETKQPGGLGKGSLNWSGVSRLAGINGTASGVPKYVNGNSQDSDNIVNNEATDFGTGGHSSRDGPRSTLPKEMEMQSRVLVQDDDTVDSENVIEQQSAQNKKEQQKMSTDAQAPNWAEAQADDQEFTGLSKKRNIRSAGENLSSGPANGRQGGFQNAFRGSRPKVITSVDEARARIAARNAKLGESIPVSKNPVSSDKSESSSGRQSNSIAAGIEISAPGEVTKTDAALRSSEDNRLKSAGGDSVEMPHVTANHEVDTVDKTRYLKREDQVVMPSFSKELRHSGAGDRLSRLDALLQSVVDDLCQTTERLQGDSKVSEEGSEPMAVEQNEALAQSEEGTLDESNDGGTPNVSEEKEELDWMRDDVLREIVFKVQANEKAGREPFDGLNSEAEALFFRGLERKFEREGEVVKQWIEERVENLDYGKGPIGVDDPPEKFQLRWKDSAQKRSALTEKFNEERLRILKEAGASVVSDDSDDEDALLESKEETAETKDVVTANTEGSERGKMKTSKVKPQAQLPNVPLSVVTVAGKPQAQEVKEAKWHHTKRWSRELRRKYEMEKDPEAKALIKEIGQDLDRWITEDEIREAENLLSRGVEGEQEYVRQAYEKTKENIKKTKEKITKQSETFGQEAMAAKYKEYKPQKENEWWWLELPYVVCIGMERIRDGQVEEGIFSLDLSAGLEGTGRVGNAPHTVAFQDRTEATQFLYMMKSQSDPNLSSAELIPIAPKELYDDAKADGYPVLVLTKGQLKMTPGQAFEDVEKRIVEIGCDRYWTEALRERSIDIDAVLEDGLGYGRP